MLSILLVAGGFAAYAILQDDDTVDPAADEPTTSTSLPKGMELPEGSPLTGREMLLSTVDSAGVQWISVGDLDDLGTLEGTISEEDLYSYDALLSPDRRTVIYTAAEGTSDEERAAATFHVVGTDGNGDRNSSTTRSTVRTPGKGAWSPAGDDRTIAVVCDSEDGSEREIRIIDLDGSDPEAVVATGNVSGPSFNSDGSLLAYVEIADGERDAGRIMTLNVGVDRAVAEELTELEGDLATGPAWSPVDDEKILFRRGPQGGGPKSFGISTFDPEEGL